jgi:mercuric ion binding protein
MTASRKKIINLGLKLILYRLSEFVLARVESRPTERMFQFHVLLKMQYHRHRRVLRSLEMKLGIIVAAAVMACLILGVIGTNTVYGKPVTAEIKVQEVMCEAMCAPRLYAGLSKVNGVDKVDVSIKDQTIRVNYDDAKVSLKQLQEKVRDLGFTVKRK